MSHDLDDALRDAMRRRAEDAPTVIDPERIRARSRQIRRRRVAESVGAALAAIAVVGGVALAMGSLRSDTGPGPVTSVPPTVRPTPTGSTPATFADLPWTASVIPYSNPGGANATQPYGGSRLVVTVNGRQTEVYDAGNAALVLVGWYGPDHRTLVYSNGDDVVGGLFAATFSPDGTVDAGHEPLTIDGSPWGVARPLPSGGFSWVPLRPGTFPGANETVDYVDDSLRVVAQRAAPNGAAIVTRSVVAGGSGDLTLTVAGDSASQTRELPASCAARRDQGPDGRGPDAVSDDGGFVALRCGTHVVLTSLDPAVVGGVTELPAVPGGGSVIATWFDPQGQLFASSTDDPLRADSTATRTSWWNAAAQRWDPAHQQNVVCQAWGGGVAFSLYAAKPDGDTDGTPPAWFSETTPRLQVSPSDATLLSYGLTFAARTPTQTPPSPRPTTSGAVSALGWVASDPRAASGAQTPRTDVVVTTGTRTVVVTSADNAVARPLGWYGNDHRTLVWEEGNGDPGLRAATFRADGTLAERPHPLVLPGVTPSTRGGGMIFGAALAVPGDGFVAWSEGTGPGGTDEYLRVSDSLQVVSRTPAAGESGLLAASGDAYVTLVGNRLPTGQVAVHSRAGVARVDLPAPCEDLSGGPMAGGGSAPLWCAAPPTGQTGRLDVLDVPGRVFGSARLDGVGRARFWWDGPTLHASTAAPGGWSLWQLTGSRWSAAPDGTPVDCVLSGGVVLVQKTSGRWYAETDPEIALDSQDAPVVRPGS
jgi:hypothetical protein